MPKPVNLPQVRRALANLDKLVAEHPELRHGEPWSDNLALLEEVTTMTASDRLKAYRARQDAAGMKRINCALTTEGAEALEVLRAINPKHNVGEVISSALITAALAKVKKE